MKMPPIVQRILGRKKAPVYTYDTRITPRSDARSKKGGASSPASAGNRRIVQRTEDKAQAPKVTPERLTQKLVSSWSPPPKARKAPPAPPTPGPQKLPQSPSHPPAAGPQKAPPAPSHPPAPGPQAPPNHHVPAGILTPPHEPGPGRASRAVATFSGLAGSFSGIVGQHQESSTPQISPANPLPEMNSMPMYPSPGGSNVVTVQTYWMA